MDARLGSKYASDFNCKLLIFLNVFYFFQFIKHAVKLYLFIKLFNLLNFILLRRTEACYQPFN